MLIADLICIKMALNSSKNFHSKMLKSLLQTVLEFFEKTPIGRLINRFNRDIDSVERVIPDTLKQISRATLQLLSTILVIAILLPLFIVPTIPVAILYILCQVSLFFKILISYLIMIYFMF